MICIQSCVTALKRAKIFASVSTFEMSVKVLSKSSRSTFSLKLLPSSSSASISYSMKVVHFASSFTLVIATSNNFVIYAAISMLSSYSSTFALVAMFCFSSSSWAEVGSDDWLFSVSAVSVYAGGSDGVCSGSYSLDWVGAYSETCDGS